MRWVVSCLRRSQVFREVVDKCDALLRPLSGWSLIQELGRSEESSRLSETEVAQPALFALHVALAALWKSRGVSPSAVVGHSLGEIAALHVAGVLDLPEAICIVWHRGRIMQQATGLGCMASVELSEDEARELVERHGDALSVGAINAPRSVVLSGDTTALQKALATLTARGVSHRMLPVRYAFHSAQMAPFQHVLVEQLGKVRATPPSFAVYSTVTGNRTEHARFDAVYFGRNLREPVRFASAVQSMLEDGCDVVIEIGPQPVLAASIAECAAKLKRVPVVLASLRRGRPERETVLRACAGAYVAGCNLIWEVVQPSLGHVVDLPTYPWQRKRHWIRKRPKVNANSRSTPVEHPLLGHRIEVAGTEAVIFELNSRTAQTWLLDHRISGKLLLPAAAVLEAFAAAARAVLDAEPIQLTGFTMQRPLACPEPGEGEARWQVVVKKSERGRAELELYDAVISASIGGVSEWRRIAGALAEPALPSGASAEPPNVDFELVSSDAVYKGYKNFGAEFGSSFRCLRDIERGNCFARALIEIPESVEDEIACYAIHPVLIDAGLQLCSVAAASGLDPLLTSDLYLPMGADRVVIYPGTHRRLSGRVHVRKGTSNATLAGDVWLETPEGAPALWIEGIRFARAEPGTIETIDGKGILYELTWHRAPALRAEKFSDAKGMWLLFADRGGTADALAAHIRAAGGRCWSVLAGDTFEHTSQSNWIINPAEPEHLSRLLAQGGWHESNALRGVVHCWSLDIARMGQEAPHATIGPELLGPGAALHLVQALAKTMAIGGGSICLVTRGAQAVIGSEVIEQLHPRAASLWGLANVIAIEHSSFKVRVIDLDTEDAKQKEDFKVTLSRTFRKFEPANCLARHGPLGPSAQTLWRSNNRTRPAQKYATPGNAGATRNPRWGRTAALPCIATTVERSSGSSAGCGAQFPRCVARIGDVSRR